MTDRPKPQKWSERTWSDVYSGWQFRTFSSKRNLQVIVSVDDMQGDGVVLVGIHLFKKALVFEFPFDGNKPYKKINWKLRK